jgi:hypothetical protein
MVNIKILIKNHDPRDFWHIVACPTPSGKSFRCGVLTIPKTTIHHPILETSRRVDVSQAAGRNNNGRIFIKT